MLSKESEITSLNKKSSIICINLWNLLTICTEMAFFIEILSPRISYLPKIMWNLQILDRVVESTRNNLTLNTYQLDGIELLNVFWQMATMDTKWTYGESVVSFLKSYHCSHYSQGMMKLTKSIRFIILLDHLTKCY